MFLKKSRNPLSLKNLECTFKFYEFIFYKSTKIQTIKF